MRFAVVVMMMTLSSVAIAQDSRLADKIRAAMAADIRTEAEVARDANRLPVETLQFFGLEDDMRVLELLPGGGW